MNPATGYSIVSPKHAFTNVRPQRVPIARIVQVGPHASVETPVPSEPRDPYEGLPRSSRPTAHFLTSVLSGLLDSEQPPTRELFLDHLNRFAATEHKHRTVNVFLTHPKLPHALAAIRNGTVPFSACEAQGYMGTPIVTGLPGGHATRAMRAVYHLEVTQALGGYAVIIKNPSDRDRIGRCSVRWFRREWDGRRISSTAKDYDIGVAPFGPSSVYPDCVEAILPRSIDCGALAFLEESEA